MPPRGRNSFNADLVQSAWVHIPPPPECVYEEGSCVGLPQQWWFEEGPKEHSAKAISICKTCPVKQPCLRYALRLSPADDHGVWGGTTRNERLKLRRRNGRA